MTHSSPKRKVLIIGAGPGGLVLAHCCENMTYLLRSLNARKPANHESKVGQLTRSKIFLLSSSDAESTLRSFIDLPNLPKDYGGELEWQWQDLPNLDGPARELMDKLHQDTVEGQVFLEGPIVFEKGCIKLLGTIDGKPRRDGFCLK